MNHDAIRLQDILSAIGNIESFTEKGQQSFLEDLKTQHAVFHNLAVIGEAVSMLSDTAKLLCPEMPWQDIKGLRNKLIHEYSGINLEIVWQVVVEDLQPLKDAVEGLVKRVS